MENKAAQMDKVYNPQAIEGELYKEWEETGAFVAHREEGKKPFTIVMPPPNITGQLHMGHALDDTLQDILIRYQPHAGLPDAVAAGHGPRVHRHRGEDRRKPCARKGSTKERHRPRGASSSARGSGRTSTADASFSQLRKLGISCDWEPRALHHGRGLLQAPCTEVFVDLYEKGLIYRGDRMINWCPRCKTSISDAEVEYEEQDGHFWHLLLPRRARRRAALSWPPPARRRMLGDTAVAVNPNDERYRRHRQDCHVMLPLMDREIPIVARRATSTWSSAPAW